MQIDTWTGCYPSSWKGIISPEAFAHPAKFSSRLIERIYSHAFDLGWLREGDRVIDPFGGVALGAWPALRLGLDWTGCELEDTFVQFGRANIAVWNQKYAGKLARWGSARLLKGDSRELCAVIQAGAAAAISSPPYADGCSHTGGDNKPGKLKGGTYFGVGINGVISSPPYSASMEHSGGIDPQKSIHQDSGPNSQMNRADTRYGSTPGQLGAMPSGDFNAAISSPPFLQTTGGTNVTSSTGPLSDPRLIERHSAGNAAARAYGDDSGQLSNMHEGDFNAAISSPPFENVQGFQDKEFSDEWGKKQSRTTASLDYGNTLGNTGNMTGLTFWSAARQIVEQVYQALAPGGHAIWVVKGFVKNGALVDFPGQWCALCESVGFLALHEHRAMLVSRRGTSLTIDGEEVEHVTENKSFFRRLAEKKGSPRIDWETVLCMEKP